jgi:outer membrane receptor protein involved in Fe transport
MGMVEVDGDPVQRRENASDGLMLGGELGARYRFDSGVFVGAGGWLAWGEVTRLDDAGDELDEPASKVPAPSGRLEGGWEAKSRRFWALAVMTASLAQARLSAGDKDDVRLCPDGPDACEQVDGYVVGSVRAGLRVDPHLQLTLGVENVLDTAYKTFASGAYAPGRNFVASVRGSL